MAVALAEHARSEVRRATAEPVGSGCLARSGGLLGYDQRAASRCHAPSGGLLGCGQECALMPRPEYSLQRRLGGHHEVARGVREVTSCDNAVRSRFDAPSG